MRVIVEATTQAFWTGDLLRELGHDVRVVDPNRTKAIGAALIKHDKLDAHILALLGCADLLTEVCVPTRQARIERVPMVSRDAIVRSRTRLVNALRGTFASEGMILPTASPVRLVALFEQASTEPPEDLCEATAPLWQSLAPRLYQSGNTTRRGGITKHAGRSAWRLTHCLSAKVTVRFNDGRASSLPASAERKPAALSHAAWRHCCGPCGRTKRSLTHAFRPRISRTTRSVKVLCSNPSTTCSAYLTLSRSTDRGRNLDSTRISSSILCPGALGPIKSTYRWVSRGSTIERSWGPYSLVLTDHTGLGAWWALFD
jgi:hypothetical protein